MAGEIIVPKLGVSTEPLSIVAWRVKEGERVEKGTPVLEVETEKVQYEIEAEVPGFVHIVVEQGKDAPIGSIAGLIVATEGELSNLQKRGQPLPAASIATVVAADVTNSKVTVDMLSQVRGKGERIFITPVARKMALEHAIDVSTVKGTGPGGRIVRNDVEMVLATTKHAVATKVQSTTGATPLTAYQDKRVKSTIPLSGTRKAIADHLHHSLVVSAQLTVMGEIEMTDVVKLRNNLVAQEQALGVRITYTDILVLIVSKALKKHPVINSSIINDEIKVWEDINIGVAVAADSGLIVPVVKNADKRSLSEISQTVKALGSKARERTLAPEEVQGGTFTITNLGALGGGYRFETVIINHPESAILGTGSVSDRVVARDGQIVIRPIMTYYFTYDHRVIDGAVAAQFMNTVSQLCANTGLLLV